MALTEKGREIMDEIIEKGLKKKWTLKKMVEEYRKRMIDIAHPSCV